MKRFSRITALAISFLMLVGSVGAMTAAKPESREVTSVETYVNSLG